MLVKPEGCTACPLFHKGKGFCKDVVKPKADFVFVGETPDNGEIGRGELMGGRAGHVLKAWLMYAVPEIRLASERGKITIANTLRCLPPVSQGKAYPKGEERTKAEAMCRQYDDFGTAHTIVLFGEAAQRHWFQTELENEDAVSRSLGHDVKGVMGRVGRVYEKDGRRWVFAPHPQNILSQPALVEHGQQALRIAANTEKVVQVDYQPWEKALEALCQPSQASS